MPADVIPPNDDAFLALLLNLDAKLAGYPQLGVTSPQLQSLHNDTLNFQMYMEGAHDGDLWSKKLLENRNLLRHGPNGDPAPGAITAPLLPDGLDYYVTQGVEQRTRELIQQVKNNPACTPAIEDDLMIRTAPAPKRMQPKVTVKAQSGSVVKVKVIRGGNTAYQARSRRGAETAMSSLGTFAASEFNDTRPPLVAGQAEVRFYEAQYLDGTTLTGETSDTVSVSTTP